MWGRKYDFSKTVYKSLNEPGATQIKLVTQGMTVELAFRVANSLERAPAVFVRPFDPRRRDDAKIILIP